ncbi:MAG: BFD-like [2Fe-2S] binding domain [Pseudomonadota bacterium]|jgi:bacterioferritin-associated ferredoxin
MLVCHCRRVSDREIRSCIHNGSKTVREVAKASGAGTCCGGCLQTVKSIVQEEGQRALPVLSERLSVSRLFR